LTMNTSSHVLVSIAVLKAKTGTFLEQVSA